MKGTMDTKRRRSVGTPERCSNNNNNKNGQQQQDEGNYEKTSSKTGNRWCLRLQNQWSFLTRRLSEDSWTVLGESLKASFCSIRRSADHTNKGKETYQCTRFRTVVIVMAVLLLAVHLYDGMFYQLGNDRFGDELHSDEYFAIAINTYKRPDRLKLAVQHYAETCGKKAGVGQVFVIWAEQGTTIPEVSSFFESSSASINLRSSNSAETVENKNKNQAYVKVLQKDKDSLNSRFEPIEELEYDAVFMVDDDIRVDCASLFHGFEAWRKRPSSMVGYYPRLASPPMSDPSSSTMIYHTWPIVYLRHKFNFVLTKASFLHAKYLALYTNDLPQEVRDHVDMHKNCEDIAMSMLVANYTKFTNGEPIHPIYVEGNVDDTGLFGGISTGSGHMVTRSDCLTTLTEIFQQKGWESPLAYEIPLRDHSWVRHAPGFWWQSKPSNFFEWISFANMLT